MNKDDFARIFADVKQNQHRLNRCDRHLFPALTIEEIRTPGFKTECIRCQGRMSPNDVRLYAIGYKAAGGDPDVVAPGYVNPEIIRHGR